MTAAYFLAKDTDIRPIVLEKEAFTGGIARTFCYKGNRMDIGGHRFFTKDEQVKALWQELMPLQGALSIDDRLLGRQVPLETGGPDPDKSDHVMLQRERISRIRYRHQFFSYPLSLGWDTVHKLGWPSLWRMSKGYIKARVAPRPEQSLADFMINRFGEPLYATFFRDYTTKVWGRAPEHIAADWGAQRIKSLSLGRAVADYIRRKWKPSAKAQDTSLIRHFWYPKHGPGQLWETMEQKIVCHGGIVRHHAQVISLEGNGEHHIKNVRIRENGVEQQLDADFVLSSMPVAELVPSVYGEECPSAVLETAEKLPYRDFMTVGLLVRRLSVRSDGRRNIVPDCWIYVQEPDVKMGRIQIFNNWSPYLVKDPDHTVWLGLEYFCQQGDAMWNMSDAEFLSLATEELVKMGIIQREDVLDGVCLRVPKAYPAYFDSYEKFPLVQNWLMQFDNLYCIGRNGQHRYNNMDHSMLTAMQAVKLIQNQEKSQQALWSVNTERNYQEKK